MLNAFEIFIFNMPIGWFGLTNKSFLILSGFNKALNLTNRFYL